MVRNRPGVISDVSPWDGNDKGRLHLVNVEYKDNNHPDKESLVWELETGASLLPPTDLPNTNGEPMNVREIDAMLHASKWSATIPYILPSVDKSNYGKMITSPLNGHLQIEDYQIVPLLKALQMPRVNLLLADDVGLGKTIEACLILQELLLRRRIQRILILTPASLKTQWKEELWDRFSLRFQIVDKQETHKLKRDIGMDANPWRSYNRIIASYHYLRQADILEQFFATSKIKENSPQLPWDMLIVDECHNLMPSPYGEDSGLCKMLREITPLFEHRLFLSATPHNGFTSSFTGLLEILDPVRFSQTNEMTKNAKSRMDQIVVRRLKSDINKHTNPPKFCKREVPEPVQLQLSPEEIILSKAFISLREGILSATENDNDEKNNTGRFAIEIFNKRLLSSPIAFATSWKRAKSGLKGNISETHQEISRLRKQLLVDSDDDWEKQRNEELAAEETGTWLKGLVDTLGPQIKEIDNALARLGIDMSKENLTDQVPVHDARFDALSGLINKLLVEEGKLKQDERLVVFTEYKTTLDYLVFRLKEEFDDQSVSELYGGMEASERDEIKAQFNDRDAKVRILVATDAASEGLNLQESSRFLLHFDCPWNPSKIEQRNGRLDRHGQARDVSVFHFNSDLDEDIKFLNYILQKSHLIKDDLGSANEIFSDDIRMRLIDGVSSKNIERNIDEKLRAKGNYEDMRADNDVKLSDSQSAAQTLENIKKDLDLDPIALRITLETALGKNKLIETAVSGTYKIEGPKQPGWTDTINEYVRLPKKSSLALGSLRQIAFSPEPFLEKIGDKEIFKPKKSSLVMAHLSHPLMQKAINTLTRKRYPGLENRVSRWTVRVSDLPENTEAQLLLSVEELAVNELRETFHHWVSTHVFNVSGGRICDPKLYMHTLGSRTPNTTCEQERINQARDIASRYERTLRNFIRSHKEELTQKIDRILKDTLKASVNEVKDDFDKRSGEISKLIAETTELKLEREIESLKIKKAQGFLFDGHSERLRIDRLITDIQSEISRRRERHDKIRNQLKYDRDRIINNMLPKRHTLDGGVIVYPVCLEIRLPS